MDYGLRLIPYNEDITGEQLLDLWVEATTLLTNHLKENGQDMALLTAFVLDGDTEKRLILVDDKANCAGHAGVRVNVESVKSGSPMLELYAELPGGRPVGLAPKGELN